MLTPTPAAEAPSLELVLKRNPVERLKREKGPLGMLDELPALIAAGYADVAEEDVVRLKWWGLYHDKPKVGTFMLRVKLAAGRLTAPPKCPVYKKPWSEKALEGIPQLLRRKSSVCYTAGAISPFEAYIYVR